MTARTRNAVLAAVAGVVVPLLVAAPAQADDRRCRGSIGPRTVAGNVIVPAGASCTLRGTRVEGNVLVRRSAKLDARGVRVDGNIQANNHRLVAVQRRWNGNTWVRSRVNGDIQVSAGRSSRVRQAVIGGNLQSERNRERQVAAGNAIGGDLQAFSNRAAYRIAGNRVDGNLQCKGNRPRPHGGGNRVQGNKEDQCRNL